MPDATRERGTVEQQLPRWTPQEGTVRRNPNDTDSPWAQGRRTGTRAAEARKPNRGEKVAARRRDQALHQKARTEGTAGSTTGGARGDWSEAGLLRAQHDGQIKSRNVREGV